MDKYARIQSRVKAAILDGIIIMLLMYAFSEILSHFDNVPVWVRTTLAIFVFILYEPIFISSFGQTIGQSYNGIMVKRDGDIKKNIIFPLAILRFVFKMFLGWISLLTITGNEKRKAIHDFIANSVVIVEKNKT